MGVIIYCTQVQNCKQQEIVVISNVLTHDSATVIINVCATMIIAKMNANHHVHQYFQFKNITVRDDTGTSIEISNCITAFGMIFWLIVVITYNVT